MFLLFPTEMATRVTFVWAVSVLLVACESESLDAEVGASTTATASSGSGFGTGSGSFDGRCVASDIPAPQNETGAIAGAALCAESGRTLASVTRPFDGTTLTIQCCAADETPSFVGCTGIATEADLSGDDSVRQAYCDPWGAKLEGSNSNPGSSISLVQCCKLICRTEIAPAGTSTCLPVQEQPGGVGTCPCENGRIEGEETVGGELRYQCCTPEVGTIPS